MLTFQLKVVREGGRIFSDKEFPSISLLFKWQKEGEEEGRSYNATGMVILVLIYSFSGLLKSAIVLAKFNFYEL